MEATVISRHKKLNRQFSKPCENFAPHFVFSPPSFNGGRGGAGGGGVYTPPFPFSYSSFPPSPVMNLPPHHLINHQNHHQPPLLPLPIPNPYQDNRSRINNNNRAIFKHQFLSVKKSNFSVNGTKRERPKPESVKVSSDPVKTDSSKRLGPDPKDVPKVLFAGKSTSSGDNDDEQVVAAAKFLVCAESTSTVLSPPPSSLPLPTFSLRPKLSCNVQAAAAEVDAGATDNLRRILRLR